jgi:hypothetical protein
MLMYCNKLPLLPKLHRMMLLHGMLYLSLDRVAYFSFLQQALPVTHLRTRLLSKAQSARTCYLS